jgi:myo-inositol-1(or 4)-monophosphatase
MHKSIIQIQYFIILMTTPLEFATQLALQTGALLQDYINRGGISASLKPDHSVVTAADIAADHLITQAIHEQYPDDILLSEESSFHLESTEAPIWIIDPLDGTTNFSLGLHIWGVSIARLINGFPHLAALYFPIIKELYTAERGLGAFLNSNVLHVRAPDPSQPMSFFACCSRTFRNYTISIPYKPRILGSAAYTFCMVARGSALLGMDVTPKIWDLAGAWLLVEEAGGRIDVLEGAAPFPVSPNSDYSQPNFPTLAAATPNLFTFGCQKVQKKSM